MTPVAISGERMWQEEKYSPAKSRARGQKMSHNRSFRVASSVLMMKAN